MICRIQPEEIEVILANGGMHVHDSVTLPGDPENLRAIRDQIKPGPLREYIKEQLFAHEYGVKQ